MCIGNRGILYLKLYSSLHAHFAWYLFDDICVVFVWYLFGICMVFSEYLHGIFIVFSCSLCMVFVWWYLVGAHAHAPEFAWYFYSIFMVFAWYLYRICLMIFAAACSCSYSPPQWTRLTSLLGRNSLIPAAPPILQDPSNSRPLCFPLIQRPFVWWLHICYQNSLIPAAPSIQRIHQTSDHPAFPCFKYPLYDGCI